DAPTNRLIIAVQLAASSEPGQPTERASGYYRHQVLSDRPISDSLSLREETGSLSRSLFFAFGPDQGIFGSISFLMLIRTRASICSAGVLPSSAAAKFPLQQHGNST